MTGFLLSRLLLPAAALGLSLSAAYAECAYHQSVQASEPETTVVASNDAAPAEPASTVTDAAKPADETAQPAK